MRRTVAERFAQRDAFAVERVGDAADGRLGALLVDVPALEMLQRPGIHDDQRRMDDRPGIHQRGRERVAAILDHAGKRRPQHRERMVLSGQREDAGRQPLGAHGDRRLERPVLAREPRQRPGLGERDLGAVAGIVRGLGEQQRAERARAAGTRPGRRRDVAQAVQAISCCAVAGVGHKISSAPRTASPMSSVTSAGLASRRPAKSLTTIVPPLARCAATAARSRRHSRISWPASAKSPAAANDPLPPPRTAMRIGAFSGKVDTGFPQKMRPLKKLAHVPEKWEPVFRIEHAQNRRI